MHGSHARVSISSRFSTNSKASVWLFWVFACRRKYEPNIYFGGSLVKESVSVHEIIYFSHLERIDWTAAASLLKWSAAETERHRQRPPPFWTDSGLTFVHNHDGFLDLDGITKMVSCWQAPLDVLQNSFQAQCCIHSFNEHTFVFSKFLLSYVCEENSKMLFQSLKFWLRSTGNWQTLWVISASPQMIRHENWSQNICIQIYNSWMCVDMVTEASGKVFWHLYSFWVRKWRQQSLLLDHQDLILTLYRWGATVFLLFLPRDWIPIEYFKTSIHLFGSSFKKNYFFAVSGLARSVWDDHWNSFLW